MNNLEQQLNSLSKIKLEAKSKADIKFKLNNLINEPQTLPNPKGQTYTPSPFAWSYLWSNPKLVGVLSVFIFTFSITYGAEFSYPNNILYPIKTNINEPLISILKTNPQTKLDWQFELTKRRLEEATHLATNNTLTPDIENSLSLKLATHLQNYKNINESSSLEVINAHDEQAFNSTLIENKNTNTTILKEDLPENASRVALETENDDMSLIMASPKEEPQSQRGILATSTSPKEGLTENAESDQALTPPKPSDTILPQTNTSNLINTLEFYKQEIAQKSSQKNSPLLEVIDEKLADFKK